MRRALGTESTCLRSVHRTETSSGGQGGVMRASNFYKSRPRIHKGILFPPWERDANADRHQKPDTPDHSAPQRQLRFRLPRSIVSNHIHTREKTGGMT